MSDPKEKNFEKYMPQLQETFLDGVLSGRKPTLKLSRIEPDGRKHSKIARELLSEGLIEADSSDDSFPFIVLEKVLQFLPTVEIDLCQMWQNCLDRSSAPSSATRPWVCVDVFNTIEKKAILESDSFDFYAVSRDAFSQWGRLAENRGAIVENSSNKYLQYWDGPFAKFSEAQRLIASTFELKLAISSAKLREFAAGELQRRKFTSLYVQNALWGLVACGVVNSDLVFDDAGQSKLDSQFLATSYNLPSVTTSTQQNEALWESNLNKSITYLESEVARLSAKLTTMKAISTGIEQFGGWEKFKQSYAQKLTQHIENTQ